MFHKEIKNDIRVVRGILDEILTSKRKRDIELDSLLREFGIFRACSNCKHVDNCIVIKSLQACSQPQYVTPFLNNERTYCGEKYWERKT